MLLLASSVCGLFKWRQFEPEVILLAVGWYLRFSLSYREVEELRAERGLWVDHVTVWRWVQRYTPELQRRLRRRLKPTSDSWRVDETYIRIKGSGATCIGRWTPPVRPSTFSSRPSRTRPQQSASWPKPWVNRTIPRRVSSTPMGMRLTRPRSLSSRVKERWTPAASTGRCRTSIMSWSRTTGPSSGGLTPARVSVLFGLPGARWPATR